MLPSKLATRRWLGLEGDSMVQFNTGTSGVEELFAGIDWGASFHQLCVTDATVTTLCNQRIGHDVAGLAELES